MKKIVSIKLESRQLDSDRQTQVTRSEHQGSWYRQDGHDYLIFRDAEGIQTTLKMATDEWRLFRRGPNLESWQVFRQGKSVPSELTLMGSMLPLLTYTKRLDRIEIPSGAELQLEYDLYSDSALLGNFTLILHLTIIGEEPAHA